LKPSTIATQDNNEDDDDDDDDVDDDDDYKVPVDLPTENSKREPANHNSQPHPSHKSRSRTHSSELKHALMKEILKSLLIVHSTTRQLDVQLQRGVFRLTNMQNENTNQIKADIKTNGKRTSELQKVMAARLDELQKNVTLITKTNKEMEKDATKGFLASFQTLQKLGHMISNLPHSADLVITPPTDTDDSLTDSVK